MKLGGVENKARLAIALFVLGLVLTIGLSLSLYFQARAELQSRQLRLLHLETSLLALHLSLQKDPITDASLKHILEKSGIRAAAAVYSNQGQLLARASTFESAIGSRTIPEPLLPSENNRELPAGESILVRTEGDYDIAETTAGGSRLVRAVRPSTGASSPIILYIFSYQVVALAFGLGLIVFVVRWLLKPYHRIIEAAQGSPVIASSARTESEFVVETFQVLINQLQSKERELAELHALERRRAERYERFNERLIASMPSGIIGIDSRGFVTTANPQAREILSKPELGAQEPSVPDGTQGAGGSGIDYRMLFSSSPKMIDFISQCLGSGASFRREEVEIQDPDGRVRHLGLSISPITDASGSLEGALCLMTDLTEVIDLRERMKLHESLANLGEMAAGLAHEFKNSLATIQGYVQLLDAQAGPATPPESRRRTLDAALNEVRLLARLVTDFLNFARPQPLNLTQVNLRSMIEDCIEELRPQLIESGIKIALNGEFPELYGDETLLRRAFSNLLRNAAEAIDPQSRLKLIEISGAADTGTRRRYAHIRIRDTGTGISEADLQRIFIPFFTTKTRGYGIGLAIVQKIIIAHRGAVSVERSDSQGTVFHCRLPLTQSTASTGELSLSA
ncbi:MAG TPA: ATP-binding protein [Blastocatellia bacterium]|nr:ATP-binding protein [Blastocatellia bacterium]